jgi:hypothetical protein
LAFGAVSVGARAAGDRERLKASLAARNRDEVEAILVDTFA